MITYWLKRMQASGLIWPMAIGLAFFALAFVAVGYQQQSVLNDKPGLIAGARSSFVDAAVASCLKTQNAEPSNKDISPSVISQYCNCYANGMADRLSNNDVKAMATRTRKEALAYIQPIIESVAQPCLDAVSVSER